VYVESPNGKVKQKAVVTEIVHPQVVVSNHDFWFPEAPQTLPELGGVFESNHNLLTYNDPSQGYDPLNGCPQLRGFLVKVYKANDGPPKGLDPSKVMAWTPVEEV
jgi:anaerobic selenocysteine-containing dehydrogenase